MNPGAADATAVTASIPWPADDPFPAYRELREAHGPVGFSPEADAWLVLGYDTAREVLRGDGWSSNPLASAAARAWAESLGLAGEGLGVLMIFVDPPDHTRLRRAAQRAFTPVAVERLRARVDHLAGLAVDAVNAGEPVDVVAEVTKPVPLAVICEWLDLGVDGARLLWDEAPALVRLLDLDPGDDPAGLRDAAGALTAVVAHLLPLAVERRQRPGGDLLSMLAADAALGLDEVVGTALLLAIAGHETTTNLVGNALVTLLAGQPARTAGWAGEPPLDELLRLDGPVQAVARTATRDQLLAGRRVRAGERVLVVVGAANRDPDAFADPDRLDPERAGPPPLALGMGRHHCLGASLARLEAGVLLRRLQGREPSLAGPGVTWRPSPVLRGPARLTVRFGR